MSRLPDILEIKPLVKPPDCVVTVPGSKSITNRALILAALSDKKCTLRGALWADDTQVMVDSLRRLGFEISASTPDEDSNCTVEVVGRGGEIPAKKAELRVGNAGTAARFLSALVCLGHGEYRIAGEPRMHERPMDELFGALRKLGARIEATADHLPATIYADGLKGGNVTVTGEQTSQFASALSLIGKHANINVKLAGKGVDDMYYYFLTGEMVRTFKPGIYRVEPDLSSASYFVAARYICGGRVKIDGWPRHHHQFDGRFPSYLPPPREVSRLTDLGDSIMTLAICGLFGKERLTIKDAGRLRVQETDRIRAMVTELKRIGAKVEEHDDGLTVWPAEEGWLHEAEIETYNDHRMAMSFSVLGLKVPGIRIKNPACVSKTFPNFFDKLEQLRR